MRAVVARDERTVVVDLPEPDPGEHELLVRVRAAGLNNADVLQVKGHYPPPPGSPDTLGLEFAGEVVAIGRAVTHFGVGDRVMSIVGGGGQAEFALTHESIAMHVPHELDDISAGGFAEAFTTAHDALFTQGRLQAGQRLLVNGAAGGVGTAAIQLGVAAGAEVVARVRSDTHADALRKLGTTVINAEATLDDNSVELVLELVGATYFESNVAALSNQGRIVVIGIAGGSKVQLDLAGLMAKRASVMSSTLRSRSVEDKALATKHVVSDVLPLVRKRQLVVPISNTFPLEEAADAYALFGASGKFGKIVLTSES